MALVPYGCGLNGACPVLIGADSSSPNEFRLFNVADVCIWLPGLIWPYGKTGYEG